MKYAHAQRLFFFLVYNTHMFHRIRNEICQCRKARMITEIYDLTMIMIRYWRIAAQYVHDMALKHHRYPCCSHMHIAGPIHIRRLVLIFFTWKTHKHRRKIKIKMNFCWLYSSNAPQYNYSIRTHFGWHSSNVNFIFGNVLLEIVCRTNRISHNSLLSNCHTQITN